jgi:indolepyruvate ferredoxin oxidoreductase beta subunit
MCLSSGSKPTSVVIAAVGGQGALLASRVLARYAMLRGFDVKVSEIHGMSQRGGSVVTHVRFGQAVHSPVVEVGTADAVVAFELLEAARYAPYVRSGGLLISSTQRIAPLTVLTGAASYPADLEATLTALPVRCLLVDAQRRAEALGHVRAVNTLLLGVLAFQMTSEVEPWRDAIRATLPSKHHPVNLAALDAGWALYADGASGRSPASKGVRA